MSFRSLNIFCTILAASCLAVAPTCFANKKAYIPYFTSPVQNYAVVDISGALATSPVTMVALDDNNHASFGFLTGDAIPHVSDYSKYKVYTWSNGTPTPLTPIPWVLDVSNPDGSSDPHYCAIPLDVWLTPSGTAYANTGIGLVENDWPSPYIFSRGEMLGCSSLPDPPYQRTGAPAHHSDTINDVSDSGYVIGSALAFLSGFSNFGFIKDTTGKFTAFANSGGTVDPVEVPGNVRVNPNVFFPGRVNNLGQAIGNPDANTTLFWDGSNLSSIGTGWGSDLNDQGQVAMQYVSYSPQGFSEGGLWDGGTTTILRDKLPYWYQWQTWNIEPFSISNQVKGAPPTPQLPDPSSDPTIHILTDADNIDVNASRETVWTRDKEGKWKFASAALPPGTSIEDWTSINSGGVIAALGNGEHALILGPVSFHNFSVGPVTPQFGRPDPTKQISEFFCAVFPQAQIQVQPALLASESYINVRAQQYAYGTITTTYTNGISDVVQKNGLDNSVDNPEGIISYFVDMDPAGGIITVECSDQPGLPASDTIWPQISNVAVAVHFFDYLQVQIQGGPWRTIGTLQWYDISGYNNSLSPPVISGGVAGSSGNASN